MRGKKHTQPRMTKIWVNINLAIRRSLEPSYFYNGNLYTRRPHLPWKGTTRCIVRYLNFDTNILDIHVSLFMSCEYSIQFLMFRGYNARNQYPYSLISLVVAILTLNMFSKATWWAYPQYSQSLCAIKYRYTRHGNLNVCNFVSVAWEIHCRLLRRNFYSFILADS